MSFKTMGFKLDANNEFYKEIFDRENVLKIFEERKKALERYTGLSLSNIEASGLRRITEEVMSQNAKESESAVEVVKRKSDIDMPMAPEIEIPARFFAEFYDIPFDKFFEYFPPLNNSNGLEPTELTKDYLKMKQAEKHLI